MTYDFNNILDKEVVTLNLQIISLHIAVYESMVDYVVENVRGMYIYGIHYEDGKYKEDIDNEYITDIKNRIVDDKGNKNIVKASFLKLKDWDIIDETDYELFVESKEQSNTFAHDMLSIIGKGVSKAQIEIFKKMVELYKKIINKWFQEIEASIAGIDLENAERESICSSRNIVFDIILDTLFSDDKSGAKGNTKK